MALSAGISGDKFSFTASTLEEFILIAASLATISSSSPLIIKKINSQETIRSLESRENISA